MNFPREQFPPSTRLPAWLCFLILAGLIVGLVIASWRRWPDVLVDYGLQLYTPWQLAAGRVLYRDVAYVAGGPLSQYYHALLFRIFGTSFIVLAWANIVLTAFGVTLLFHAFARVADRLTALVIGVVTLAVFAFGHLTFIGGFNFISPYTSETVDGLILAIAGVISLNRWLGTGHRKWVFITGLCLGSVFLTKPEIFLALVATIAIGAGLWVFTSQEFPAIRGKGIFLVALGAGLPIGLFAVYFIVVWPTREGLMAVAGAWLPLLRGTAGHGQFYDWCMGLDQPVVHLAAMAQYAAGLILVVALLAMAARRRRSEYLPVRIFKWGIFAATGYMALSRFNWVECGRALPPIVVLSGGFHGWLWWGRRREKTDEVRFMGLWSVFALVLMAKMGLFPRIWHYGFYLALPATVLGIHLLLWALPRELDRVEVNVNLFRTVMVVMLCVGVAKLLWLSNHYYAAKNFALGSGGDRIMSYTADMDEDARANACSVTVNWVVTNTLPTSTLAVLPEGAIINYLTRRLNPTPFLVACPHELQVAGESQVLAAFVAHPPDYIILLHRETAEFGVEYFGADRSFGHELMPWVKAAYNPIWLLGHEPLQTNTFGIKMLERNRG